MRSKCHNTKIELFYISIILQGNCDSILTSVVPKLKLKNLNQQYDRKL